MLSRGTPCPVPDAALPTTTASKAVRPTPTTVAAAPLQGAGVDLLHLPFSFLFFFLGLIFTVSKNGFDCYTWEKEKKKKQTNKFKGWVVINLVMGLSCCFHKLLLDFSVKDYFISSVCLPFSSFFYVLLLLRTRDLISKPNHK